MNEQVEPLYIQAQNASREHRWRDAKQALYQLIKLLPEDAEIHNNYANVLQRLGNDDEALRHYHQAVQLEPSYVTAHFNLGLFFLRQHDFSAASKQFNNVLALAPNHPTVHYYLGNCYLQQEDFSKAEQHYLSMLAVDPEHRDTLNNLGVLCLKIDAGQRAVDYFTQVLALDPDDTEARSNIANTFIEHGRHEQALTHYQELLQLNPDDIETLYNTGVALTALREFDQAQAIYQRLLAIEPNHVDALANCGCIAHELEDRSTARDYFSRVLELEPDNTYIAHMLAAQLGQTHEQAPNAYSEVVFDHYAGHYDEHLCEALSYRLPEQMMQVLQEQHLLRKPLRVCDIGCGTGLFGAQIKAYCDYLLGIDLSEKMLAEAAQKGHYHELLQGDFRELLRTRANEFDLLTALDVFSYVGDLSDVMPAIARALKPGGYACFSVEPTMKPNYILQETIRYGFNHGYVMRQIRGQNLSLLTSRSVPARTEKNRDLTMRVYLVQKPS